MHCKIGRENRLLKPALFPAFLTCFDLIEIIRLAPSFLILPYIGDLSNRRDFSSSGNVARRLR